MTQIAARVSERCDRGPSGHGARGRLGHVPMDPNECFLFSFKLCIYVAVVKMVHNKLIHQGKLIQKNGGRREIGVTWARDPESVQRERDFQIDTVEMCSHSQCEWRNNR